MNDISVTEVINSVQKSDRVVPTRLKGYSTVRIPNRRGIIQTSGTFCTSIKMTNGKRNVCFRIWRNEIKDIKERCRLISDFLFNHSTSYFVGFQYEDKALELSDGSVVPGMIMDWIPEGRATELDKIIEQRRLSRSDYSTLAKNFLSMCRAFKSQGISHGDLSAKNIFIDNNLDIILIDYDSLYLPNMRDRMMIQSVGGTPEYQHPERPKQRYSTDKDDYFSQYIIYLFFLACSKNLDTQRLAGDNVLLFTSADLSSRSSLIHSQAYRTLYSLHDYEVNHYLSLLETNIQKPYNQVNSILDCIYSGAALLPYCRICGAKFASSDQIYCQQCGTQRGTLEDLTIESSNTRDYISLLFGHKVCPSCHYKCSDKKGNYCGNCGKPYDRWSEKETAWKGTEISVKELKSKYEINPKLSTGFQLIWKAIKRLFDS